MYTVFDSIASISVAKEPAYVVLKRQSRRRPQSSNGEAVAQMQILSS